MRSAVSIARSIVFLSTLTFVQPGLSNELNTSDVQRIPGKLSPVIVLDIEMLGDTSIKDLKKNDEMLIKRFSKVFRQLLKNQSVFDVIDDEKSIAVIEQAGQRQFLHRCNGCELDLAKQLGAKQIIVPWIFRMSILIQTLVIEVRDAETGSLVLKKPYNFRGNSDKAWGKTLFYAVRDLKESLNSRP